MSTNKFLGLVNGVRTWFTAITTSTGVSDAGKILATDANGKIDSSFMPAGIGAASEVMVASEALTAGDFVNIWLDTGTRKARKADASNGRAANGFVTTNVALNANATVILQGANSNLTGLTIGSRYFLSATTPGGSTLTAPTTISHIIQELGIAVSATSINFEYDSITTIQ
jgi:hypothetical protein